MTIRRVPTNLDPTPAEVLSAADLARAERFKAAYALCALPQSGFTCMVEAARVSDGLRFVRWRRAKEQAGS